MGRGAPQTRDDDAGRRLLHEPEASLPAKAARQSKLSELAAHETLDLGSFQQLGDERRDR